MTDALTEAPAASLSDPPTAKVVADEAEALTVATALAAEFRAGASEQDADRRLPSAAMSSTAPDPHATACSDSRPR
ncbi:hypothetical protein [Streptomyces europaeiscabiei]|uniref:hypothetical protein n=1 Tax=Streptomyces europaeiscabiei TaxID=146819 RepID=UPI0038F643FB